MQERYSAQAILSTGKVFVFDDVGCLVRWLGEQAEAPATLWVWNSAGLGGWLPATEAVYLRSDSLKTPMGSHLAAVQAGPAADSLRQAVLGTVLDWEAVRATAFRHEPPASP